MNASETLIKEMLEARGFRVLRNGWPDFLCIRDVIQSPRATFDGGKYYPKVRGLCAVEVKVGKDKLSEEQKLVHQALQAVRVPVYVIRPDVIGSHQTPKTRHFMTHAEIAHLEAVAEKAKDRLAVLRGEAAKLEGYLSELNHAIEASGAILSSGKALLEEGDKEPIIPNLMMVGERSTMVESAAL